MNDIYEIFDTMQDNTIVNIATNLYVDDLSDMYNLPHYDSEKLFGLIMSKYIEMVN